jgi:ketosteroid isomerase-like protein
MQPGNAPVIIALPMLVAMGRLYARPAAGKGMMPNDTVLASLLLALMLFAAPACATAETRAHDKIKTALVRWTEDFNAGKADAVCALFSPELRYDFRGYPERGYADICARLKRSLGDASKRYTYALDIREIVVSGDIGVVRLVWTLTVTLPTGQAVTSVEPGMDVFRKEPDGTWKIIRYLAYAEPEPGAGTEN